MRGEWISFNVISISRTPSKAAQLHPWEEKALPAGKGGSVEFGGLECSSLSGPIPIILFQFSGS